MRSIWSIPSCYSIALSVELRNGWNFHAFPSKEGRDRSMPVAGRAVISYTCTVGRCHPEHERARYGAVSGLIKSIQLGGLLS